MIGGVRPSSQQKEASAAGVAPDGLHLATDRFPLLRHDGVGHKDPSCPLGDFSQGMKEILDLRAGDPYNGDRIEGGKPLDGCGQRQETVAVEPVPSKQDPNGVPVPLTHCPRPDRFNRMTDGMPAQNCRSTHWRPAL